MVLILILYLLNIIKQEQIILQVFSDGETITSDAGGSPTVRDTTATGSADQ